MSASSTRLRIWGSGVRISPGAPPSTRLRTPRLGVLARENGLFEQLLVAFDTDLVIIDFDHVDKRPEVRLPKGHRSGAEVLTMVRPKRSINAGSIRI